MSRTSLRRAAAPHACAPALRPAFPLSPLFASVLATLALAPLAGHTQTPVAPTLQTVDVVAPAPSANGKLNLDTPVETGSRLGLTARETPASVTVVDRATIDARGAQDTQEILRAIPGVTAHNAPGSMAASYRGFTGNSVT